jgi:hypothetical protein
LKKTLLALKGTIKPIYNTEVSKKIPAKILALVGVKDPVTEQLKFPSGEVTIQHTADNFLLRGLNSLPLPYIFYLCFQ